MHTLANMNTMWLIAARRGVGAAILSDVIARYGLARSILHLRSHIVVAMIKELYALFTVLLYRLLGTECPVISCSC